MRRVVCVVGIIVIVVSFYSASESRGRDESNDFQSIKNASGGAITLSDLDLAVGILDMGEVKNTVFNNGLLATWGWSGYIIPELPAGYYKGYGYIPDLNIWMGVPEGSWNPPGIPGPTVSEAQLQGGTNQSDWDPTPGSLGRYHSGAVLVDDIIPWAPLYYIPIMATSTIPESWPEDEHGNRFWPGPWAVDPNTGEVVEGHFVSDKDVFFSITDGPYADRDRHTDQGFPLDVQLDISGYSYLNPYEDFLCFPMKIINTSEYDYHGLYIGFYYDADVPEYDQLEIINDRMDWMAFNRDHNMAYIFDYRWGAGEWPEQDPGAYQVYCGVKLLETPEDSEGNELGLTDWHWFEWENRPGVVIEERQELIQYKVLSGDTTDLWPEEKTAYFHSDLEGNLDPHFDSWEAIQELYPDGTDCVFLMSSGPFSLAAGETTTFAFSIVMGDHEEDLLANSDLAQALYDNHFVRLHPYVEEVTATVEQVALDTSKVIVTSKVYDPDGIASVTAVFECPDEAEVDSILLFDDGQHYDGEPGDNLYGNSWYISEPIKKYVLDISATDLLSNRTNRNNVTFFWAGKGVQPPLDLYAEPQEYKVYLNWTPNPSEATAGYKIYYDTDSPEPPYEGTGANQGASPVLIDAPYDSYLVFSGLENDVTYYLTITAYDTLGIESGYPDGVIAVPGIYPPPEVRFEGLSLDGKVELDWGGYEDRRPADLETFDIYRDGIHIGSTMETEYLDTGVLNGITYQYYVTAVDSAGNRSSYPYSLDVQPAPLMAGFPLRLDGDIDLYSPTVVDIDGGNDQELIVVTWSGEQYTMHCLKYDGRDLPGWPVTLGLSESAYLTSRAVGDLDHDGALEIVAGSVNFSNENGFGLSVYAWNNDGTPLNGWPMEIPEASQCYVALGDIDGDNDLEVIAGAVNPDFDSGSVWVWHHDGSVAEGWPIHNNQGDFRYPTVGDMDGDGRPEIICAADSLFAWRGDGSDVPGWPRSIESSYNPANIGDIDGDGEMEILLGMFAGTVQAWRHRGAPFFGWPVYLDGVYTQHSALGDLDGDSRLEFVIGNRGDFNNSILYALNDDGTFVSGWPFYIFQSDAIRYPRICDIDGDGDMEVLADVYDINSKNRYFAWHHDGTVVDGWPITTYDSNYSATICDMNGDGDVEIVSAQDEYIVAYSFGFPYIAENIEWGMPFHDVYLSNTHGFEPHFTDVLLNDFQVVGRQDKVVLHWSMVEEVDILGFHVLRSIAKEGQYQHISSETIPAGGRDYSYVDNKVSAGSVYYYKIEALTATGEKETFGPQAVKWVSVIPKEYRLFQNYPNPFNPTTDIRYQIPDDRSPAHTTLKIFNLLGQEVRTLVDEVKDAGYYSVTWDGRDNLGNDVPSGVYFYRLTAGDFMKTRKMILTK